MKSQSEWALRERLWVGGTFVFAFILASWSVATPGLHYDEMLFVNAARGTKVGFFVLKHFWRVPLFLMDYIGALKAWIYFPIFALCGISPETVRYPSIVFALVGGVFCIAGLRRLYGPRIVIPAAALLLLDPTILMHARLDWGPNALMFLFRGVLIYALTGWLSSPGPRWIVLVFVAIALGCFDKLNFLWCAMGLCGAFGLAFFRTIAGEIRQRPRPYLVGLTCVALLLWCVVYRATHVAADLTKATISWPDRAAAAWNLLRLVLAAGGPVEFVSPGTGFHFWTWFLGAWISVVLLVLIVWWKSREEARARLNFWILAFLGTTLFFVITKLAEGQHHAAVVAGFPQLILICAFAESYEIHDLSRSRLLDQIFQGCILYLSILFVVVCIFDVRKFAAPTNPVWDPVNARAARFAASFGETVITGDWGLGTQVVAFAKNPGIESEEFRAFLDRKTALELVRRLDRTKSYVIIYHFPEFEVMRHTAENLELSFEEAGLRLVTLQDFPGISGRPAVRVARLPAE